MWADLDVVKTNIKEINEDISDNNRNIQMYQQELNSLVTTNTEHKKSIEVLFKKLADAEERATNNRNSIVELESFQTKVSVLNHLMEIDDVWKQTEEHKICIEKLDQTDKIHTDRLDELVQADGRIFQRIDSCERDINDLKGYKEKLNNISHLEDVDDIWKSVGEHTSQLIESEKRAEELIIAIQKNRDEVDKRIEDVVQTANATVESLTKRVKYAYWLAGGSAGDCNY